MDIELGIKEALKIANEAIDDAASKDPATVQEVLMYSDMLDIKLLLERALDSLKKEAA